MKNHWGLRERLTRLVVDSQLQAATKNSAKCKSKVASAKEVCILHSSILQQYDSQLLI